MSLHDFFIGVIVCRARNIKTAAVFANWLVPKKGTLFSLIIFGGYSVHMTFRIITSFREPCHMPLHKLIPPFTLSNQKVNNTMLTDKFPFQTDFLFYKNTQNVP